MEQREIAVINKSTLVRSSLVRRMATACNFQLRRHAAPAWGRVPWPVRYRPSTYKVPKDGSVIPIVIMDSADAADALGYHTETPEGLYWGRVFVEPVLETGGDLVGDLHSVSMVLAHEVLEVFINPDLDTWSYCYEEGLFYVQEVCDPVQAQGYSVWPSRSRRTRYSVGVSNFVLPSWFDEENPSGVDFDFIGNLDAPFEVASDGYAIATDGRQDYYLFGSRYPHRKRAKTHPASRSVRIAGPTR